MPPRIGLLRLGLATHPTAEPLSAEDLRRFDPAWADDVLAVPGSPGRDDPLRAAVRVFDATGPWTPVPLFACAGPPSGPLPTRILAEWRRRLATLLTDRELDALLLVVEGSLSTTDGEDGLAAVVGDLREAVGTAAHIVATIAPGTQFAEATSRAVDAALPARSSTGGDRMATAEQAALVVRLLLAGAVEPASAYVALPLVWPRTGPAGTRFEALQYRVAQLAAEKSSEILAAGLVGGHVPPLPGSPALAVVVTGRHGLAASTEVAREFASLVWDRRDESISPLLPLSAAVALARTAEAPAATFVDAGDRIDLGAAGHATELLSALAWGGAKGVLSLGHVDRRVVEQALAAGVGGTLQVTFAATTAASSAVGLSSEVEVDAVARDLPRCSGDLFGREPVTACRLHFGEMTVIVTDSRTLPTSQLLSALDCELTAFRIVVTKSDPTRSELSDRWPAVVHEVEAPGPTAWTSAGGARHYPLDRTVSWSPGS